MTTQEWHNYTLHMTTHEYIYVHDTHQLTTTRDYTRVHIRA